MSTATYVTGDVFGCLAATPDGSVDLVLTSPPFLALRSYLPADHPDKAKEIGAERNPAEFVDTLLRLSAEFRRVLAPHGSIAVELGDTYSGSGGAGGDYAEGGLRGGQLKFRQVGSREHRPEREGTGADGGDRVVPVNGGRGWPEAKSACLVPELYRVALAYGINPLTGQTSPAGRWRIRNTVRWCRPNPPVGALGDKFRPATSDMVIACLDTPQGQRRYFDLDAVRETSITTGGSTGFRAPGDDRGERIAAPNTGSHPAGAPPLDWWEVSTEPYAGSHYATWPRKLLERPIKAMVPQRACTVCGEPSRRIVERSEDCQRERDHIISLPDPKRGELGYGKRGTSLRPSAEHVTLGWTDCGHDAWRTGLVLDPFGGSGTTLAVATGHGHMALGFDLDERNVDLARERIGPMFFTHLTLDEYRERNAA